MSPRRAQPKPLEVLVRYLPALPIRAAEAGLRQMLDRQALAGRIRGLFASDRAAAPVLVAIQRVADDPDLGPERASVIATVLELFDDIEGDVSDFRGAQRSEAVKLRAFARAARVTLAGLREWERRVEGLGDAIATLHAMRGLWLRHARRFGREAGPASRRRGRPSRILSAHEAVSVLRACGLSDPIARKLAAAAAK